MWLIASEELLLEQSPEFVLCYHTKSAFQHHSGGAILHKTVHNEITTALAKGVIHFSDYLSRKEAQIQDTG